jgi:hypothetical protein
MGIIKIKNVKKSFRDLDIGVSLSSANIKPEIIPKRSTGIASPKAFIISCPIDTLKKNTDPRKRGKYQMKDNDNPKLIPLIILFPSIYS